MKNSHKVTKKNNCWIDILPEELLKLVWNKVFDSVLEEFSKTLKISILKLGEPQSEYGLIQKQSRFVLYYKTSIGIMYKESSNVDGDILIEEKSLIMNWRLSSLDEQIKVLSDNGVMGKTRSEFKKKSKKDLSKLYFSF